MTKKELYRRVKLGYIYGRNVKLKDFTYFKKALWGDDESIMFENYGRTGSKSNYKDFVATFNIMFHGMTANEFMKEYIEQ